MECCNGGPSRSGSQPGSQKPREQEAEGKERSKGVWKIGTGHLERRRTGEGRERKNRGVWEEGGCGWAVRQ